MSDAFDPKVEALNLINLKKGYHDFSEFQTCLLLALQSDNKLLHDKMEELYMLSKLTFGDTVVKYRELHEDYRKYNAMASDVYERKHKFEKAHGLSE